VTPQLSPYDRRAGGDLLHLRRGQPKAMRGAVLLGHEHRLLVGASGRRQSQKNED
jgi:hypothetical protein